MGTHVLRLGWTNYAIHGTNKPPSIGLRGTHGCLRMYPEDIVRIYSEVPVGVPVRVVNQPTLFGWRGDALYGQAYPVLEDDKRNQAVLQKKALSAALKSQKATLDLRPQRVINQTVLDTVTQTPRAIAIPLTQPDLTVPAYLARATRVENRLPLNSTWLGDESGRGNTTIDAQIQPDDTVKRF